MDAADIDNRFEYHPPDEARALQHQAVRGSLEDTAHALNILLPEGREKSLVITHLEEAMFWANAAIARQPVVQPVESGDVDDSFASDEHADPEARTEER
jgi:hypothetical protein